MSGKTRAGVAILAVATRARDGQWNFVDRGAARCRDHRAHLYRRASYAPSGAGGDDWS